MLETIDNLAEWLADQGMIYGPMRELADGTGHHDECPCRLCWTIGVKDRMRRVVRLEAQLGAVRGGDAR